MSDELIKQLTESIRSDERQINKLQEEKEKKEELLRFLQSSGMLSKPSQVEETAPSGSVADQVREKLKELGSKEFTTHDILKSLPNASSATVAVTLNRFRTLGIIECLEAPQGRKGGKYKVVKPKDL